MKTLILYASKYGAAQEIARRIANRMGNADTYDLKQSKAAFPLLKLLAA